MDNGDNNCHDNDCDQEDVELVLPLNPPSLVAWGWRCLSISLMMVMVMVMVMVAKIYNKTKELVTIKV